MSSQAVQNANSHGVIHDLIELVRPSTPLSRACLIMLAASVTTFACVALLTLPGLIFDRPDHNVCFLFSRTLQAGPESFLPMCLSGLSSAFALVLPVPRQGFHPKYANRTSEWTGAAEDWRG